MPEKAKILVIPAMFAVVLFVAWWAFSGVAGVGPVPSEPVAAAPVAALDPVVPPTKRAVELPRPARAAPAPLPGLVSAAPAPPPASRSATPFPVDEAERAERVRAATIQATGRRVQMMQRMFEAAPMVVPDEDERVEVRQVLDAALDRMGDLEARVERGDLTYRDAVQEMDAVRDEAAKAVDGLLPPGDADAVKLRMGVRPPPPPPEQVIDWEGGDFEEHLGDGWE